MSDHTGDDDQEQRTPAGPTGTPSAPGTWPDATPPPAAAPTAADVPAASHPAPPPVLGYPPAAPGSAAGGYPPPPFPPAGAGTPPGHAGSAPPPPPWYPGAGIPAPGTPGPGNPGPGSGPPYPPPSYPPGGYPYGTPPPQFPYPGFGAPYGTPAPYAVPRGRTLGPLPVIAMVIALLVAAAAGAGVEYALNNNSASGSSSGIFPLPSGNSGSGGTGSTGSGPTVPNGQVSSIAAKVDPGLVDIDTTLASGGGAAGTGMVLTSSGLVLTNNHVIENASSIVAQVDGVGRSYDGTVVGYSITDDVALVQLKDASGLRTVSTASSSGLSVGSVVVGIGNAGGVGGTPSAVGGTITALNQTITASGDGLLPESLHGLIETDANIEPGDSGGPLVDSGGHVIGMDTAAAVNGSGFGSHAGANQGYAIGIDNALSIIDQIRAGDASATVQIGPRALLGVEVSDGQSPSGALVQLVEPGSPAQAAGITQGDTIVSVDSASISNAADLSSDLVTHKPGETVTVGWVDASGARHSASVKLTVGPPA